MKNQDFLQRKGLKRVDFEKTDKLFARSPKGFSKAGR